MGFRLGTQHCDQWGHSAPNEKWTVTIDSPHSMYETDLMVCDYGECMHLEQQERTEVELRSCGTCKDTWMKQKIRTDKECPKADTVQLMEFKDVVMEIVGWEGGIDSGAKVQLAPKDWCFPSGYLALTSATAKLR